MLAIGDKINLTIDTLSSDGQGIAHYNGMAVFVPSALPGENVSACITKVTSSYAIAQAESIENFSSDRQKAECPAYGLCGGCDLMHIDYAAQLEFKRQQVKNALERIGGFRGIEVNPVIGMDDPWNYRNKAVFSFARSHNKVVFGCIERRSHNVIPVPECLIQFPESTEIMNTITDWADKFRVPPYDVRTRKGILRHAVLRKTKEGIMAVVVTTGSLPNKNELVKMLTGTPFPVPVCSILHNINSRDTNLITGKDYSLLYGRERLIERIGDLDFSVSAESFLQVNPVQTNTLYLEAINGLELEKTDNVIDLYCGIGTISLLLSKHVHSVTGVEYVRQAVRDAELNAKLNGIKNAGFVCGKVETVLPELIKTNEYSALVLDPPRKGADKQALDAIVKSGIPRIAYVSCDPATLARDCKILCAQGYKITSVQPVDMFPQTHHVETVCLLSKLINPHNHIEIDLDLDELDLTSAESKATYQQIKDYVSDNAGLNVSSLYVAQVKNKCGIRERANYNHPKNSESRQPECPPEKERAIRDALKHFGMI